METDKSVALRAELHASLDAMEPELRGLNDLARIVSSSSAGIAIRTQIDIRTRRRDLILDVIAALDALADAQAALAEDGYPDFPRADIEESVLREMQEFQNALGIAAGMFGVATAPSQDQETITRIDSGMKDNLASMGKAMA